MDEQFRRSKTRFVRGGDDDGKVSCLANYLEIFFFLFSSKERNVRYPMSDKYLVEISLLYDNLIKVKKILVGKIIIRGFRKIFCKSVRRYMIN